MRTLVLLGSTRNASNSTLLAARLTQGVPHTTARLTDYTINPIVDQRHDEGGFTPVDDDFKELARHMINHDRIIFATPLYWYGMSGPMKNFVDRWSQYLRDTSMPFKASLAEKEAYVIITGGPHSKSKGLPLVTQFHYICDFVGMKLVDYVIGRGVRPGEVTNDLNALATIDRWNDHFKKQP
ncbi:NAD(P)H-dependent oxidoreductase [Paenalkalicoccus suaedae]|uniref:NAD(P)H-dependent oxidoreductase n=1 Tax=Paenalkalicoccus suaedae TaxID=2592382 RepID=A0A859FJG0_9BACI|nr:NAD(P)H-dependent oxidoreductase [Paenalkalicoccus suaedae]QKS72940.1 NAD(P)H-dependent oxidoreductase [Paenalkalicoccus suaedae]